MTYSPVEIIGFANANECCNNKIGYSRPYSLLWVGHVYFQCCSVLAKSHLGAKRDFEIWAFKVFFLWTPKAPLRVASRGSDLNIKIG